LNLLGVGVDGAGCDAPLGLLLEGDRAFQFVPLHCCCTQTSSIVNVRVRPMAGLSGATSLDCMSLAARLPAL
jgi:hypothetical protein